MSLEDLQKRLDDARGAGDADDETQYEDDQTQDDGTNDNHSADSDEQDEDDGSQEDDNQDDDKKEKDDHTRTGTMSKIGKILKGVFGKDESTDDSTDDDDDNDTGQEDEESDDGAGAEDHDDDQGQDEGDKFIDPKFVDTARRYGWTDDQIVAYANENSVKDVIQLGAAMEEAIGQGESTDEDEESDTVLIADEVLAKLSEDEENQPIIDQVVKPLLQQVKALQKDLKGVQHVQSGNDAEAQNRELKRDYDRANSIFDAHSKEFDMLGSTDKLKRMPDNTLDVRDPAVRVRREVFTRAMSLRNADPSISMDEAMEDAMYWFRGKYGQQHMEKKLLTKIKKQSKKVSPKSRSQHKTRKFANDRERKASVVQDVLDRGRSKRK